jgi:hypothetical protein
MARTSCNFLLVALLVAIAAAMVSCAARHQAHHPGDVGREDEKHQTGNDLGGLEPHYLSNLLMNKTDKCK